MRSPVFAFSKKPWGRAIALGEQVSAYAQHDPLAELRQGNALIVNENGIDQVDQQEQSDAPEHETQRARVKESLRRCHDELKKIRFVGGRMVMARHCDDTIDQNLNGPRLHQRQHRLGDHGRRYPSGQAPMILEGEAQLRVQQRTSPLFFPSHKFLSVDAFTPRNHAAAFFPHTDPGPAGGCIDHKFHDRGSKDSSRRRARDTLRPTQALLRVAQESMVITELSPLEKNNQKGTSRGSEFALM